MKCIELVFEVMPAAPHGIIDLNSTMDQEMAWWHQDLTCGLMLNSLMLSNTIMLHWISCKTNAIAPITWFWPSGIIWVQRSGSTLAEVMACCHYLDQCCLIISDVQCHSYQGNFARYASVHSYLETVGLVSKSTVFQHSKKMNEIIGTTFDCSSLINVVRN